MNYNFIKYETLLEQEADDLQLFRAIHDIGRQATYLDRKLNGIEKHLKNAEYYENKEVLEDLRDFTEELRDELWDLQGKLFSKTRMWKEWLRHVKGFGSTKPSVNLLKIWSLLNPLKAKHISCVWSYAGLTKSKIQGQRDRNGYLKNAVESLALICVGMMPGMFNAKKPRPRKNFSIGGYGRYMIRTYENAEDKYPDWSENHRFRHSVVMTAKLILTHQYMVWHWFYTGKLVKTYAVEKGLEDYMYMPVYDKYGNKPEWWHSMERSMVEKGIRPVEL